MYSDCPASDETFKEERRADLYLFSTHLSSVTRANLLNID
jgi:hypothetical protein